MEGEGEVGLSSFGVEFLEIEGFGVVTMYERTERHPVVPTAREVLNLHVLSEKMNKL